MQDSIFCEPCSQRCAAFLSHGAHRVGFLEPKLILHDALTAEHLGAVFPSILHRVSHALRVGQAAGIAQPFSSEGPFAHNSTLLSHRSAGLPSPGERRTPHLALFHF